MTDIARLALDVDTRKLKAGERDLKGFGKQSETTAKQVDRDSALITDAFRRVGGALAAGFTVTEYVRLADTFSSMNAQLRLVTGSAAELADVERRLFEISQNNRVGFESTVDLYSRIARSTQALGVTQEQTLRVTDTINKALVISGTSAQQASGALMQLGQAFASGTLRGDELNSILEGMPRVAQAIAEGMGVTVGQLRELGAQGQLTSEQVFNALLKMGQGIDQEFSKMPTTVGQAFTVIGNSALRMIGVFDQANNVSSSFANAVVGLARAMDGAGGSVRTLLNAAMALGGGFAAYRLTLLAGTAAQSAYTAAMVIGTRAIGAAQAGTLGLNAALLANPFTAVAAAVGILAASFIGLASAQSRAKAETDSLITSLKAAAAARSADFASQRAQLQYRIKVLESSQTMPDSGFNSLVRSVGGGAFVDAANAEKGKELRNLRRELALADKTYEESGKAADSIVVPTGKATAALTGLGNAASASGGQASQAADDFQRLYERLFPFEAAMRQLAADEQLIRSNKNLTEARKEEMLAALEQERFRSRTQGLGKATVSQDLLNTGPLVDAQEDFRKSQEELARGSEIQTVRISQTFAEMARSVTSSLQGLANSIRSGDFLGILSGVLDIFTQLGSAGVFGKGLQGRLTAPTNRSMGGPVYAGKSYIVGERGPELFTPPGTGRIVSNDNMARDVNVTVGIDPRSGNVLAFVDGRIAATAPLVAQASAQQAQAQAAASARRRVR